MSATFENQLAWQPKVVMYVDFTTEAREVTGYSVVLTVEHAGEMRTVRVYDAAHWVQRAPPPFARGRKGGRRAVPRRYPWRRHAAAIDEIRRNYAEMIDGWRR